MKKLTQAAYRAKRVVMFLLEEKAARLRRRHKDFENPDEENDNLPTDGQWEIISEKEVQESILTTSDSEYETHDFSDASCSTLPLADFIQFACHFPPATFQKRLHLIYSSSEHGSSLQTMFGKSASWAEEQHCDFAVPCVLIITDTDGHTFGAYCTHLPHDTENRMIGSGETKLFKAQPHFEVYSWTGENDYFLHCNKDQISIGGSHKKNFGPAVWIDKDFKGRSMKCETFNSDILSSREDFKISNIEIWGFSSPRF